MKVVLVRHGETEWSKAGRHTGRNDVPLTDNGRRDAQLLRPRLERLRVSAVFTSPLSRARDTCRLALPGADPQLRDELLEWDYGAYEGLTKPEIRERAPGWVLWRDGCPDGEQPAQVGARVDRFIGEVRGAGGDVVVFAHGHVLRTLAVRWIGLAPEHGASMALETASMSTLGYEREIPVIRLWNDRSHLRA